jgi:serine/threonine protein kinase
MSGWETNWEIAESKQVAGGQGVVVKVRNKETNSYGALKTLHMESISQKERRLRFKREVETLAELNIEGVPKIFEHNVDDVLDKDKGLYFICEWIDGQRLSDKVNKENISIEEAVNITLQLCEILSACHKSGICHRDIKPDNILITDQGKLFLVDFGIAYSDNSSVKLDTELGQELGNRFLRIPDLAAGREKRSPRADITLVVGILFYLITKKVPRILINEKGHPPHVALANEMYIIKEKTPNFNKIERIFEIGFKPSVDLRFQKIEELKAMLEDVLKEDEAFCDPLTEELEKFNELVNSAIVQSWSQIESKLYETSLALEMKLRDLAHQNNLLSIHNAGFSWVSIPGKKVEFTYTLCRNNSRNPNSRIWHSLELVGDTNSYYEASYKLNDGEKIVYRHGLASDIDAFAQTINNHATSLFSTVVKDLREKIANEFKK